MKVTLLLYRFFISAIIPRDRYDIRDFNILTKLKRYQENCPPENFPLWKYPSMNILPMKAPPCENYPPEICHRENYPLAKLLPMKSPPHL